MIIRICIVKILLKKKKSNDKNHSEGQIVQYFFKNNLTIRITCLIRNLVSKTKWDKKWTKKKRVLYIHISIILII